ncbi:MAG: hypothetical protein J6V66_06755, partial [Clostridia bacterium]|nr:hypothetical protein [Clostridia bacterium]
CALSPTHCLGFAKNLEKEVTFVVDNFQKAIFIKTAKKDANIHIFYDGYDDTLVPFLACNHFNIKVKYTALAPERIEKFKNAGVEVNGYIVNRLDELGVLQYWNCPYVTIDKNIK